MAARMNSPGSGRNGCSAPPDWALPTDLLHCACPRCGTASADRRPAPRGRFPLQMISRMRFVVSVANTLIAPLSPAGTIAAFDLILPSIELSVATSGLDCPEGHNVRNPKGPEGTTATFIE